MRTGAWERRERWRFFQYDVSIRTANTEGTDTGS